MILIGRGLDLGKKGTGNREQGTGSANDRNPNLNPGTERTDLRSFKESGERALVGREGSSSLCGFEGAKRLRKRRKGVGRPFDGRSDGTRKRGSN